MKTILLFTLFLFSGCCVIGQIPPQIIYADDSCKTVLPDYRTILKYSDNCKICQVEQTPAPGLILCDTLLSVNVVFSVIDCSGNFQQVRFPVVLVDTIKPVITYDSLAYNKEFAYLTRTQIIYLK
jgi:hypothetical protein